MKSKLLAIRSASIALMVAGCLTAAEKATIAPLHETTNGMVVHEPSGMQFPPALADFTRISLRQYDAAGLDVSAGYNSSSPSTPVTVTLYVYPSPPVHSFGSPADVMREAKRTLARQEFERRKAEVLRVHPAAQLVSSKELDPSAKGRLGGGYFAKFTFSDEFAGQTRPVESLLYVYCYVGEKWTIKYRITYPAGSDAQPAIDRFLSELRK